MRKNKTVDTLLEYYIVHTQEFKTAKQIETDGDEHYLATAEKMDKAGLDSEDLNKIFCCGQKAGFYAGFEMAKEMFS